MTQPQDIPRKTNLNNELAKERNRAAAERTLMAWIRTSLSLIGFGFGIDRVVTALHAQFGDTINPFRLSRILGLSFIALGAFGLLAASLDHQQELRLIRRDDYTYTSRRSYSLGVAWVLVILGVVAFFGILLSSLS